DAATGKVSIIGLFDRFVQRTFPSVARPFTAFLQMTDGIGEYAVTVEIHDLQKGVVLARVTGLRVQFPERASKINLMIAVVSLPQAPEGSYAFVGLTGEQDIRPQQFAAELAGGQKHVRDDGEGAGEH